MIREQPLMTVDDYLALPEVKPYLEFVNGRVCAKPMGNWRHSQVAVRLLLALAAYAQTHGGAPNVEGRARFAGTGQLRFLLPDVSFYVKGRPFKEEPMPPPTLAVEVRSPEQSMAELREKCRFYREHGVDVAWLIDPEHRRVEVFEAGREGIALPANGVVDSAALPGFSLTVQDLFAPLDAAEQ